MSLPRPSFLSAVVWPLWTEASGPLQRVAKAWRDLLQGYRQSLDRCEAISTLPCHCLELQPDDLQCMPLKFRLKCSAIGDAIFHLREGQQQRQQHASLPGQAAPNSSVSGLVLVRDIDFTSISQSSLLPFCGRCHVAYLPRDGVVLGLSKFARLTVLLAKRLQSQQQLAAQILSVFVEHVMPHGAAVIIEASHLEQGPDAPKHVSHAVHGTFGHPDDSHLQVKTTLKGKLKSKCLLTVMKGMQQLVANHWLHWSLSWSTLLHVPSKLTLRMTVWMFHESCHSEADVQIVEAGFKEARPCMCIVLSREAVMRHVEQNRRKRSTWGSIAFTLTDSWHLMLSTP